MVGAVALALAALAVLVLRTGHVLLLIFAGLLFAVLLSAAADALVRVSGMRRGWALALTLVLLTAGLAATFVALWPSLSEQIDQLATEMPAAIGEMRRWIEQREWGRWLLGRAEPDRLVQESGAIDQATGALMSALSALAGLVVVLFVGVYVAAQPVLYHQGLRRLVPPRGRLRVDAALLEVTSVLRWWLVGKLLSMTIVGVLTTVGLWWLDVPLALTFGLLAAALTFIPNIGPVLSVAPPAILALADEPRTALYVVGLYLAIQTVESYAITPIIQHRTVSMPPALTITAQVVLGVLAGAIGVAVATPLTAAAMTLVRMLYVEDVLERPAAAVIDESSRPGTPGAGGPTSRSPAANPGAAS